MITADDIMDMFEDAVAAAMAAYRLDEHLYGAQKAIDMFNARTNGWFEANAGLTDNGRGEDLAKGVMAGALLLTGCIVNFEGMPDD